MAKLNTYLASITNDGLFSAFDVGFSYSLTYCDGIGSTLG